MHIENELLMHCMQSVGKTMETNIIFLDCLLSLELDHQHDVIMHMHA